MAFGRSACVLFVAAAGLFAAQNADAWVPHVITKGNKFFDSETGLEFRMKGMAYSPTPNAGNMSNVKNYDWTVDEHEAIWTKHIAVMKDLGVNTVRLYSVDPSKSHDKFMCACSEAGIYVLVGMAAPCEGCAVQEAEPPKCYPDAMFARMQMVYNAFAVYDNTLAFSVANEPNLVNIGGDKGVTVAPCVKAMIRDARKYAGSCAGSLRQVPIGLDIADIPPRSQWLQYYDCPVDGDENSRAEWIGSNPYVECDPLTHKEYTQSTGLTTLMKEYADTGYSRPIMFGEFGCNEGENTVDGFENQRSFYDAKWMNEEAGMTDVIVGGNVFEFTTEVMNLAKTKKLAKTKDPGKFGIGYFQPDDCDNVKTECKYTPYPEYDNLKKAYTTTKSSTVKFDSYTPKRDKILTCPSAVKTTLPSTPAGKAHECSALQPVCNGKKANAFKKTGKATAIDATKAPTNSATAGTVAPGSGGGGSSTDKGNSAIATSAAGVAVSLLALAASAALAL
ncbi:hypothetical protein PybrP1_007691 [[Pythium] brassicae (nom. inval.)]|nr:hypothetical protein PybrP1_007691 [[Pythium] brassicae (nom. inval.)]